MTKLAKVVNRFGNEFNVPLYKAREMQMNGEIDDFTTFEYDGDNKNIEAPETQDEFNKRTKK